MSATVPPLVALEVHLHWDLEVDVELEARTNPLLCDVNADCWNIHMGNADIVMTMYLSLSTRNLLKLSGFW